MSCHFLQFYKAFALPRRFLFQLISPEKKDYAKVAIPLSGCQGQALRVFEKKSPRLRSASGSIFFQKTLTAAK